ncbi:MAG: purine-nucleoside phosphorylase [Bacilli bacterium]
MSTPHNNAELGQIAKTVLMPGDPLRAKFIAEHFLTDCKLVNTVRNMFCYTGTYKGKRVSVMGSGMGIPSIGIYAYELYHNYDVDRIIRIGTAGSIDPELKIFDIVIGSGASSNSNFASQYNLPSGTMSAVSSFEALSEAVDSAKSHQFRYKVGQIFSSDNFYNDPKEVWEKWASMGCLAIEMEAYGLYLTAAEAHKEALAIVTISDSMITHEETTSQQREQSFTNMMEVALDCIKE